MLRNAPPRVVGVPPSCEKARSARLRRFLAPAAVAFALALAPAISPATVYKWVDANGRVVYSDQPPPPNVKTEVLRPPPPPANPAAAQELSEREEAEGQKEKKRTDEAKVGDKARADYERRREVCVNAMGEQKALQQRIISSIYPLYRFNEKGERVIYTDEMRRVDLERLQQVIRENCPG